MPKLTDTQSILLSNAAQRAQHSLYPLYPLPVAGAHRSRSVVPFIELCQTNVQRRRRRDGSGRDEPEIERHAA